MLPLLHYLTRSVTTKLYELSLKTYNIEKSIAIKRIKRAEKYNKIMNDTINENIEAINTLKSMYNLNH